jgi:hypothetical protein
VCGSMSRRMSRTSWVSELPTWPCRITNDLGTVGSTVAAPDDAVPPLRCVLFLRRLAMARGDEDEDGCRNFGPG